MRAHPIALILLTSGLLAACGDSEKTSYSNPATGETVTMQSGNGLQAPTNMPDFAPLYPGAQIENVVQATSSNESGAQRGAMLTFSTPEPPETVATFYREKLDASDLKDRNDASMNGTLMLTAGSNEDSDRGVQITVMPATDRPGSHVTLIYNLGKG